MLPKRLSAQRIKAILEVILHVVDGNDNGDETHAAPPLAFRRRMDLCPSLCATVLSTRAWTAEGEQSPYGAEGSPTAARS